MNEEVYTLHEKPYFLEYHEKFKNTKKISTNHKLFTSKKDRISCLSKVPNNFSVLKKHGIPCWRKYHFASIFWIKRRLYFPSPKNSKQELFRIQKTWYSMLKKLSSYINFSNQKKTVFPISENFKARFSPQYELFLLMQNSCFCNNFFFSFKETHIYFNHFKNLNLHLH